MSFYICKPGLTAIFTGDGFDTQDVVIEGIIEGEHIVITAPKDTAEKWPTVLAKYFAEVDGPARGLTGEEYIQLARSKGLLKEKE